MARIESSFEVPVPNLVVAIRLKGVGALRFRIRLVSIVLWIVARIAGPSIDIEWSVEAEWDRQGGGVKASDPLA